MHICAGVDGFEHDALSLPDRRWSPLAESLKVEIRSRSCGKSGITFTH